MSRKYWALIIAAILLVSAALVLRSYNTQPQESTKETKFRISASSPETMEVWNSLPRDMLNLGAPSKPRMINKADIDWNNLSRTEKKYIGAASLDSELDKPYINWIDLMRYGY